MGQTQSNNLWIGFVAVAAFFVLLTMVVLVVLNLRHKRKKKKEKKKLQDELYDYEMGRTEKRMTDIQAQPPIMQGVCPHGYPPPVPGYPPCPSCAPPMAVPPPMGPPYMGPPYMGPPHPGQPPPGYPPYAMPPNAGYPPEMGYVPPMPGQMGPPPGIARQPVTTMRHAQSGEIPTMPAPQSVPGFKVVPMVVEDV
eukprot:Lankesteria_metandrocarpae@DN2742_c0_g1_i2.p1